MAAGQPTRRGLPRKSPLGSYVYALRFSTGLVKVGFTGSPSQRIRNHMTYLLPFGISIDERWISEPHGQAKENEALLLDFCRSRAAQVKSREYFTGVDFAALLNFAGTLSYVAVAATPGPQAAQFSPWKQAAAAITARIDDGIYPAGSKVPSVVDISTEFGVAASTAQKVLAHLKAEGLVRTEVGLGTFVADRPEVDES